MRNRTKCHCRPEFSVRREAGGGIPAVCGAGPVLHTLSVTSFLGVDGHVTRNLFSATDLAPEALSLLLRNHLRTNMKQENNCELVHSVSWKTLRSLILASPAPSLSCSLARGHYKVISVTGPPRLEVHSTREQSFAQKRW